MGTPVDIISNNLKGILFMVTACVIITVNATIIKFLGQDINTFQVVSLRCIITLMITLFLNYHIGKDLFNLKNPRVMTYRSLVGFIIVVANFYAISTLPLVEVTALQFTKPLFLILLAVILLAEKIKLLRTVATIVGFIGVLIILRPWQVLSGSALQLGHLAVLVGTFSMALLPIFTRILAKDHKPITMVFYANALTITLSLIPAYFYWITPTMDQLLLIIALGVTTFCSQYCMINAYKNAEVTILTPIEYLKLIFAAIVGYFVFTEIPDQWTIWGGALICSSTLFLAYREAINKKTA